MLLIYSPVVVLLERIVSNSLRKRVLMIAFVKGIRLPVSVYASALPAARGPGYKYALVVSPRNRRSPSGTNSNRPAAIPGDSRPPGPLSRIGPSSVPFGSFVFLTRRAVGDSHTQKNQNSRNQDTGITPAHSCTSDSNRTPITNKASATRRTNQVDSSISAASKHPPRPTCTSSAFSTNSQRNGRPPITGRRPFPQSASQA